MLTPEEGREGKNAWRNAIVVRPSPAAQPPKGKQDEPNARGTEDEAIPSAVRLAPAINGSPGRRYFRRHYLPSGRVCQRRIALPGDQRRSPHFTSAALKAFATSAADVTPARYYGSTPEFQFERLYLRMPRAVTSHDDALFFLRRHFCPIEMAAAKRQQRHRSTTLHHERRSTMYIGKEAI